MSELFIELFSEEIPARMQVKAAEDLRSFITNGLIDKAADTLTLYSASNLCNDSCYI